MGAVSVPSATQPSEPFFQIDNVGAVSNGARSPATFSLSSPMTITRVRTYHWNGGRGAPPGTIGLRAASGSVYGPWQATGEEARSGGAALYWNVTPSVRLPAGENTVVDSDAATWSNNAASGYRGMVRVYGVP